MRHPSASIATPNANPLASTTLVTAPKPSSISDKQRHGVLRILLRRLHCRSSDFAAEADDGATNREQLSDVELRLTCSEGWLTIHEEDENGQAVPGSYEYECLYGEDM